MRPKAAFQKGKRLLELGTEEKRTTDMVFRDNTLPFVCLCGRVCGLEYKEKDVLEQLLVAGILFSSTCSYRNIA